jgi:hypothetical protein
MALLEYQDEESKEVKLGGQEDERKETEEVRSAK